MAQQSPFATSEEPAPIRARSGTVPMMSSLTRGETESIPIYKFVLTGGPCAGKTTSLERLSTYFRERGFRVYMVPEASTLLQSGGAHFLDLKPTDIINFQWAILSTQMQLEDTFVALARDTKLPCVILCDRGAMDGSAYMDPEEWEDLKLQHDLDTVTLRDTRYNAVFHLVTTANGAPQFYTLDNNGTRIETIEQACAVDERICHAWIGHPKLFVFDNSTGFESKMQRLINCAATLTGLPSTVKSSKKFLLRSLPSPASMPVHCEEFEVEKVYLMPHPSDGPDDYVFVRCRTQYGIPVYGMTTVRTIAGTGEPVHLKRVLSAREYTYAVRHRADPSRRIIKQKRICFLWKNQSFNIHIYKEPIELASQGIVHIQASIESTATVMMPGFLDTDEEMDESHPLYTGYHVSLKEMDIPNVL
ncbi:hypothetical protein SDRG_08996 [Saprolegnia diclina VS20]|uniref:NadR/Ttd14 AAA domain-containing protein n=1 Tax=Saprolegnia diclina (strain VS20) TaxID=1156394 RepID=T0RT95_SAPDV|nr:hypothetical protein SDRG_08996 [Saprolegnia diclina VS20]EQC33487.1 hypothetical protein SDRG_08996 [Saprolegnia diclina VS20]|eukprot:XP_008613127.1 hypothetical protein SDRG_08996 [Saprolegnia diclina VS20]